MAGRPTRQGHALRNESFVAQRLRAHCAALCSVRAHGPFRGFRTSIRRRQAFLEDLRRTGALQKPHLRLDEHSPVSTWLGFASLVPIELAAVEVTPTDVPTRSSETSE